MIKLKKDFYSLMGYDIADDEEFNEAYNESFPSPVSEGKWGRDIGATVKKRELNNSIDKIVKKKQDPFGSLGGVDRKPKGATPGSQRQLNRPKLTNSYSEDEENQPPTGGTVTPGGGNQMDAIQKKKLETGIHNAVKKSPTIKDQVLKMIDAEIAKQQTRRT